jgi:hypothetical protein
LILLRKVCTCQKLKFSFLMLEYCKIRECYAVARMLSRLETCVVYSCIFRNVLYQNRSPQAGKRENLQFVDLSTLQFTSDESEFIPDYI